MMKHISSNKNLHIYQADDSNSDTFAFHIILLRGSLAELPGEYGAASLVSCWIKSVAEKILTANVRVSEWGSSIHISIDAPLARAQNLFEFASALDVYPKGDHEIFRSAALEELRAELVSDAIEFQNLAFSKRWIGCVPETFRTPARAAAMQTITPDAAQTWFARNWNRETVVCVGAAKNLEVIKPFQQFCAALHTGEQTPVADLEAAPGGTVFLSGDFVGIVVPVRAHASPKELWMARTLAEHIQLVVPEKIEIATHLDGAGSALLFWTQQQDRARAAAWLDLIRDACKKTLDWNLFEEEMVRKDFQDDFETMRTRLQSDAAQLDMIVESVRMNQNPIDPRKSLTAIERVTDAEMREFAGQIFNEGYMQMFVENPH